MLLCVALLFTQLHLFYDCHRMALMPPFSSTLMDVRLQDHTSTTVYCFQDRCYFILSLPCVPICYLQSIIFHWNGELLMHKVTYLHLTSTMCSIFQGCPKHYLMLVAASSESAKLLTTSKNGARQQLATMGLIMIASTVAVNYKDV